MNLEQTLYALDLFGVAVFAVSGSLAAGTKKMDIFGVAVLGLVTAVGGGTLRDTLLDSGPVFWITNPEYLLVAASASILTFFTGRTLPIPQKVLFVCDAIGLAVFSIIGTQKALGVTDSTTVAIVMGVMTGVAGGIIRDVLSAEVPLILRKEIYATAALCGSFVFIILDRIETSSLICILISMATTLSIRLAAIHWGFSLPVFAAKKKT
jgi:uncharacterized membrane protein YeiH